MTDKDDDNYQRAILTLASCSFLFLTQGLVGGRAFYRGVMTWRYTVKILSALTVKKQLKMTVATGRNYELAQIHSVRAAITKLDWV